MIENDKSSCQSITLNWKEELINIYNSTSAFVFNKAKNLLGTLTLFENNVIFVKIKS